MSMQPIYQPLLIKALVECGGSATVRQLARAVLALEEPQIRYYESRIKAMPVPVPRRHAVVERSGDLVALAVGKLSPEERSQVLLACETKIHEFFVERGEDFWASLYEADAVPLSNRYEALKRSGRRCEPCGVAEGDSEYEGRLPLHVGHMVPRSRGGSNDLTNLQVLCKACNLGKENREQTDFRG